MKLACLRHRFPWPGPPSPPGTASPGGPRPAAHAGSLDATSVRRGGPLSHCLRFAVAALCIPRFLSAQTPDSLAESYLRAVADGQFVEALELAPVAPLQAQLDSLRLLFPSDTAFRRALHLPPELDLKQASAARILGTLLADSTRRFPDTQAKALFRFPAAGDCPPLSYAVVRPLGRVCLARDEVRFRVRLPNSLFGWLAGFRAGFEARLRRGDAPERP